MTSIVAYFEKATQAERALGAIRDHGVEPEHLSLITKDTNLDDLYTAEAAKKAKERTEGVTLTTGDDAATGALKGTGLGLGVGV